MSKTTKFLLGMIVGAVGAATRGKLGENGGLACVFGHKWNGCTCKKCGTVRDVHHRMVSVPGECAQQCAICGKTGRIVHKYKKDPDTGDYICVVCGINREDEDREMNKALKVGLGIFGAIMLIALFGILIEEGMIWLIVLLIVFSFLCFITAMVLRHCRLKRQQDIDILNADVSKIGDEAARRAKKYQDK